MRGRLYPQQLNVKAVTLRSNGFSLQEISEQLGGLPENTILSWVKTVRLTSAQQNRLKEKALLGAASGRQKALRVLRAKIQQWKVSKQRHAVEFVRFLHDVPGLAKLACALLYVAEGHRYPATRYLGFSSSDPAIVRLFLKLLRRGFDVAESKFRCRVSRRWDQDYEQLK